MVGLQVVVQNENGSGISGIPVRCKVMNANAIDPFAPSNYYITLPDTNSSGSTTASNVQGYATFYCTANANSIQPNYTSGSGTASTSDLSGGYTLITLQEISTSPPTLVNDKLTCPSGYNLVNGQCVQGTSTESITQSISDWISSHTLDFVLVSVGLVAAALIVLKLPSITGKIRNSFKRGEK